MTITAAADGSALGNPGPAGWAWYVDDTCWAAGGWPHGTNNQGELKAVLELFRATAHLDEDLLVLCDSQYVINSVTKWMPGWKKKGWRKGDGKPVMNLELLQEIDAAIAGRRYRFEWVRGHIGHELNEAADVRARGAAEAYQRGKPPPRGPGWPGSPAASAQPAPSPSRANPAFGSPSLFDLGGEFDASGELDGELETDGEFGAAEHTIALSLSAEEYRRLIIRAKHDGLSPEDALRRLI